MKTIAQQLNVKKFPFEIKNSQGKEIYYEESNRYWCKREYDSQGNVIYLENSEGLIMDNRPKPSCEGKTVEIDGVKYKLVKE
jgi:hypothetical protein